MVYAELLICSKAIQNSAKPKVSNFIIIYGTKTKNALHDVQEFNVPTVW